MDRLEALALSLGYKLGGLEEPFERKTLPRRKPKRECLNGPSSSPAALVLGEEKLEVAAQSEHKAAGPASPIVDSSQLTT